ncbi:MAG: hypothetical protein RBT69_11265 [Spirochaetia bacterium]|nr:hypothetical protein [Spirochaetia bacterium]
MFKNTINRFFSADSSLQSIVISSNDKIEYLYIKNTAIITKKPVFTPDFVTKPEYSFNRTLYNLFSVSIIIPGSTNLSIETVYNTLKFHDIAYLIKIIIIVLLFYIIITIFFLLFLPEKKKAIISVKMDKQDSASDPVSDTNKKEDSGRESLLPVSSAAEEAVPYAESIDAENIDEKNIEKTVEDKEDLHISEKTGLAWFEYFYSKLSFELDKAASFDTDLTLFILSYNSSDREKSNILNENLPELLRSFYMPEMAFEFNSSSFAVINPGTTLEECLPKINAFVVRLKHVSDIEDIFAGVSSRNGRLISGKRLVKEAEGALAKAVSESGTPVIAFRSDPEKYRKMLSAENPN